MNINAWSKSLLVAGLTLFVGLSSPSLAAHTRSHVNVENTPVPSTIGYARQGQASSSTATTLIKSSADLQAYLANHAKSPLDALSPAAKQRFLGSLVFTDKGLASFRTTDLESELTPTQIYSILQLFGLERDTALLKNARVETARDGTLLRQGGGGTDHVGWYCDTKQGHTCRQDAAAICTANC